MENKKGVVQNQFTSTNENTIEIVSKHSHQHNANTQHIRLLQYGLKMPTHQHPSIASNYSNIQSNTPHTHQHLLYNQAVPQTNTQYISNQSNQYIPRPHQNQNNKYQSTQIPLVTPHNSLNQNSPQIWVPHQPPLHYHQEVTNVDKCNKQNNVPQVQNKSKDSIEKKNKTIACSSQLKSPSAKRPLEAPVTMQGWLHKQGSEGFMLWKRRWFVLSEYCLFYYKGMEEEKILGSILLPSYKVSICTPEDKVSRKFAFKCEHANMRTYILAADSHEIMMQWINVLNMACLLQTNNLIQQQHSALLCNNDSSSNSQAQSQTPNSGLSTSHKYSSSITTNLSNSSQQELSQCKQPLYANAPPKPRRLNDGSYSSPSPDNLCRNQYFQAQNNLPKKFVDTDSHSTYIDENNHPAYIQLLRAQRDPHYLYAPTEISHNVDRRTPDTYGRSNLIHMKTRTTDYEDIYLEQSAYKRPLSPISYNYTKPINSNVRTTVNPSYEVYTPVNMVNAHPRCTDMYGFSINKKPSDTIARPHSADFLEYEVQQRKITNNPHHLRPKSSLDINKNSNEVDNFFYSEQRYAENMRKSAQYLPKYNSQQKTVNNSFHRTGRLARPTTLVGLSKPEDFNNLQPVRSHSALSEGSIMKEINGVYGCNPSNYVEPQAPNLPAPQKMGLLTTNRSNGDLFIRSASARFNHNDRADTRNFQKDGDKKREESMKRLLEWKQRMLQSPLNRKSQASRPSFHMHEQSNQSTSRYPNFPIEEKIYRNPPQYNSYSSDDEASGSISLNMRGTFPKAVTSKRSWPTTHNLQDKSSANNCRSSEDNLTRHNYPTQSDTISGYHHKSRQDVDYLNDKMNVSAGELLGRTHEELVLLLIQLRRHSANKLQAIEHYYNEIDNLQVQMNRMDQASRLENLQKLEQIKQHLIELERQYEKGKPLVNLVDNMVKLGSLYRSPWDRNNTSSSIRHKLHFNQQIQEGRLLADEQRDYKRLNPSHTELQEKVQQLYHLDRLIQEESGSLQTLQKNKVDIERALGGLRNSLNEGLNDAQLELAKKQQIALENDLSRVHLMLAQNSKKLEETVAGNAKLEQELLLLKQKFYTSKQQRSSPQISNAGDSLPCVVGTNAMLESDLQRVQQSIGDLYKQRQELSMQVRQLTDRSTNLSSTKINNILRNHSDLPKKKINFSWRETDLDTMAIIDHGNSWDNIQSNSTPLYINTNLKQTDNDLYNQGLKLSDSTSEDTQVYTLNPIEKQEIKTVRIVKRESERRQRDREKPTLGKWDALFEEDSNCCKTSSLKSNFIPKTYSSESMSTEPIFINDCLNQTNVQSSTSSLSLPQSYHDEKLPDLSPVFHSEAAREIITEMSIQETPKQINRRTVPREKRRHYTEPNNNLVMKSLTNLPMEHNAFDKMINSCRRARDDLDMERALRQKIDAPDVVRSTLSNKEFKYNENTIDNILGTPNKISIPERYIPEKLPQLSAEEQEHRLKKVELIKKMLSETTILSSSSNNLAEESKFEPIPNLTNNSTAKITEEKKQRQHLLQLNQILAKQVMEMSKIVAGSNAPDDK